MSHYNKESEEAFMSYMRMCGKQFDIDKRAYIAEPYREEFWFKFIINKDYFWPSSFNKLIN